MSISSPSPNEDVQRWTAKRKAAQVEVARQYGLTVAEVDRWCDDFITQGAKALCSHPRDHAAQFAAREQQLLAKVGELTLAVDILGKAHRILGKDLPDGIS